MNVKYDRNFPIRGLYYDKQKGCLLKLDFFGSIELDGCFYGRQKAIFFRSLCFIFLLYFGLYFLIELLVVIDS